MEFKSNITNIEPFINMNCEELKKYIISSNSTNQKYLLSNEAIRTKFMQPANHYPFVWLVQELNAESILFILDDDFIPLLIENERLSDKLNAIMTCGNKYIGAFLAKDILFAKIIQHKDYLKSFLYALNYDFGVSFCKYLLEKNPENIHLATHLSKDVLIKIFSDINLQNNLLDKGRKNFILSLPAEVLNNISNNPIFLSEIRNFSHEEIARIATNGFILPSNITDDSYYLDSFSSISDTNQYRTEITQLSNYNQYFASKVEAKRKQEIKKLLNNPDVFQLLKERDALEYLVDYFFEDHTYNVLKNLKTILSFNSNLKIPTISNEKLETYNNLLNYSNLTIEDKINLFKQLEYLSINSEIYYEDFRKTLNQSYEMIRNSLITNNDLTKLSSETLSKNYGIDISILDGEPFKSLITVTNIPRDTTSPRNIYPRETSSLSLIGDTQLRTFSNPHEYIVLGFQDFDIDYVMHEYESDSYSTYSYSSTHLSKAFTPDSLLNETQGYNEILYKNIQYDETGDTVKSSLKPNYIVAYDEIKNGDIAMAQHFGIPIIIVNTIKYPQVSSALKNPDVDREYGRSNGIYDEEYYKKI